MSRSVLFILLCVLSLFACKRNAQHPNAAYRSNEPWVFRSVLDSMPRMVTLALHDDLWLAYHTDKCSIYKVWQKGVDFTGAVYNTDHGPQPATLGDAWFENQYIMPWFLLQNGKESVPKKVQYRGHRFENGQVWLNYELTTADDKIIKIEEQPDFFEGDAGNIGLERKFRSIGTPTGTQVGLHINVASVVGSDAIATNGTWILKTNTTQHQNGIQHAQMAGDLLLSDSKITTFSALFVRTPMVINEKADQEKKAIAALHPGQLLMNKNDCKTCHNQAVQTVGPSYEDIAKRYPNTTENLALLSQKVQKGGAGVWGAAAMTAHPGVALTDIQAMVGFILSLNKNEAVDANVLTLAVPESSKMKDNVTVSNDSLLQGIWVRAYQFDRIEKLADIKKASAPIYEGALTQINAGGGDYKNLTENFALIGKGYIDVPKDNNYLFRLNSDDGASLAIDGQMLCNNDGLHGDGAYAEAEIQLKKGLHRLDFEYFNGFGGRAMRLYWKSFNQSEFELVPADNFKFNRSDRNLASEYLPMALNNTLPGDGAEPVSVHPGYTVSQARPNSFLPKVGGIDFLPDGNMLVSTWDANGSVFRLDNVASGDTNRITATCIANGLAEPLGLKVFEKDIYVLQKQELTRLRDLDGDGLIDEYFTVCNAWKVSGNFHEFAFGLVEKDGWFYATLATAIQPGGASTQPQIIDRGRVIRINAKSGELQYVAQGLRTPNGIGIGVEGEIFVADNQGDWLPSSKIVHVKQDAFYGALSVDSVHQAQLITTQPVVWLPQDEIGNSPSQPCLLKDGPYKGQMMHGEVTHGGLKRVFVEKVNGLYQGCVFRFMEGLEAGINRVVYGPDNAIYVGGIGNPGNWGQAGKFWYGLQRLVYTGKSAFEMLAVRAKTDGLEIEFTEPLEIGNGIDVQDYAIKQWFYKPTASYGGPKMDETSLLPTSLQLSPDRKKVFLKVPGIKAGYVVYLRLRNGLISSKGQGLWSTEAWYTMNHIPQNDLGFVRPVPLTDVAAPNQLTAEELQLGWTSLFDGKTTKGWHTYGKNGIGKAWKIDEGNLTLDVTNKKDWQAEDGGDIVTEVEYENFELRLEWKVADCGNSGIIYGVAEDLTKYDYCWKTGLEMQVLDNRCHADAQYPKHRAGDLYDLQSSTYESVKPAGQWNKVRIISTDTYIEHWLNGYCVVHVERKNIPALIANSKFKDWSGFGTFKKGKIALQDHGDRIQYRNIKIRNAKKQ